MFVSLRLSWVQTRVRYSAVPCDGEVLLTVTLLQGLVFIRDLMDMLVSTFSMIKNRVGISLIELLIAIALMGGFHVASNEAPFERMLLHH